MGQLTKGLINEQDFELIMTQRCFCQTKPDNGDQFRTVLFVLVGVTVALSAWLANTIAKRAG